nr:beta-mannosidase isoform X1 [Osmia lignaria]
MSDNMQRDKPELLTAKEKKELEEMKKELLDMKMYETGYTYKHMKQILGVINESKNMANMSNDEKNVRKELLHSPNNCTRDVMPKTNLTQELEIQEHNDTSQSIHSYRPNRASPIREQMFAHGCSSPDLEPVMNESRNSMYRSKNVDAENMFVKLQDNSNTRDNYIHNMNRYISLKSKSSLQDSDIINSIQMKMDTHSECEQKLDSWQINPLDSYVSENDVPLQEPNRPVVQDRMPFRLCKEARTPEMLEKLLPALNIHLKETAELWHSWHRTTDTKFQWGSPIQVGLTKDSSNRKLLTNSKTEQNQMENTNKRNSERANKRKSTLVLSSSNTEQCSNDEDEKIVKRPKIRSQEDINKVLYSYRDDCPVISGENDQNLTNDNVNKDFDNVEIDNCEIEPTRKAEERLSPELVPLYPRRIMPPNVRKTINKKKEHTNVTPTCSLAHSSSETQSAISSTSKENNNILTDEEILIELEKDNIRDNIKTTLENVKIKPLPIKGLSRRLKNQCMVLEQIKLDEQKQIEVVEKEAKRKEIEERKKREKFYKKQVNEMQKREKQKEEEEKFREEKSKKWKNVVDMKYQKKNNKNNKETLENIQDGNKLYETMEENELLQDNDTFEIEGVEVVENDSTNNIDCPICNKSFPTDEIETHAAGCEQYITENEYENTSHLKNKTIPMNSNNSEILECNVCSKFKTTSGIDYEDHVNKCLLRHEEQSVQGKIMAHDKRDEITFPATVPGGIYTDLNKANIIPDNFITNNDIKNRWVGNQSVIYNKNFYVNDALLSAPKVILIFHGVDTFATIFLNNEKVAETSNMFLQYTFDVKHYLKKGENLLQVSFSSAVKIAESLYNEQASKYIIPPVCVPNDYNGECHVNHIRKMQASFSWDWGPAFPSMGIWKGVELIPINEIYITDVTTDIYKEEDFWNIVITVLIDSTSQKSDQPIPCHIFSVLRINEQLSVYNSTNFDISTKNEHLETTVLLKVPTKFIDNWWPNGYGNQTLYSLNITAFTPTDIKKKTVRIGFRTVELVQKPLEKGLSFYFQINGVPMFAKGSNFIPASIFPELSAKPETIEHLLTSVKQANMNMLRVWGGGLYESELFYDLADKYGIMIWQDFMFACGMYPTAPEFLKSVKEEVIQNVRRLKNHPSIVVWAGNNENEAALYGNWYGTGTKPVYKTDYIKLYVDVIKKTVNQLDLTRPFVESSPSNGLYTEQYNYIGEDPYSNFYGDVHYYNYINNGWDVHQYPRSRFSSEYGFQSLPSIYTMLPVVEKLDDLNLDSDFMKHREHLPLGISYLKTLISQNFKLPETQNNVTDFIYYIYLSQINQAVSVKIQTEFYRQSMSELNEIGEGMTMGALYWQLNDVWQAPSWSSIDINGRWKMLHYYAAEFFAPIIVTYYVRNMDLSFYIVSDKLHPITNTTLEVNLYTTNNMKPIKSYTYYNITIKANAVTKIHQNLLKHSWILNSTLLSECQYGNSGKNNCITTLTLKDKTGSEIAPRNYIYPTGVFKTAALPIANVSVTVNNYHLPGKYFNYPDIEFELTTNNITFFVWLETSNICGHFSENGFHMFESNKKIIFHACEAITPKIFKENLNITTLSDININKKMSILL